MGRTNSLLAYSVGGRPPMHFEHVKVLPFVGDGYKKETPLGLPVLIVGESHYNDEPLHADFTKEVVQLMLDAPWKPWMNFFAKTAGVCQSGWRNRELRRKFWSSVVFYNFIQETVGAEPRMRPTDEMWRKAGPAFVEALIEYEPGFVLVLGNQLWANLPPSEPGPYVMSYFQTAKRERADCISMMLAMPSPLGSLIRRHGAGVIKSGRRGYRPHFRPRFNFKATGSAEWGLRPNRWRHINAEKCPEGPSRDRAAGTSATASA